MDLVQISVHYPCSDLCIDWQGRIYSISGNSDQYPALSTAIDGGLFHASCKHSSSAYIPGTSKLPDRDISKTRNAEMYEAQQRQRTIERRIRKYKRRKAAALTDDARNKAQGYISKWQEQQRELIENNSFLRRRYSRESV